MRFVVKFRSDKSPTTNRYPHAVLVQDNWDDYGYKTTFQVTLHLSTDESYDLGSIKIIQLGVPVATPTCPSALFVSCQGAMRR